MNIGEGKKVFVGMSGGVDSSVAALLLKRAGYDVTGVFIKVWDAPWLPCDWREERRSAMRAAAKIGIPFRTLDLEKEYKEGVVDYMISEYVAGRIPNPDVFCNKRVKFGGFFEYAMKSGADFVATGHYARVVEKDGERRLATAKDIQKEQSYFLFNISKEALQKTMFPIGDMKKSEVRTTAEDAELVNADKKDSQGICFLGPVSIQEFLSHYVQTEPGHVLNENGEHIGEHDGALFYTIGQRHGFRIFGESDRALPQYVVSKNMQDNTITVGPRRDGLTSAVAQGCVLKDCNFLAPGDAWHDGELVIRYHGERIPLASTTILDSKSVRCVFLHPVTDIALGQAGVYYVGEECCGGGIISEVL